MRLSEMEKEATMKFDIGKAPIEAPIEPPVAVFKSEYTGFERGLDNPFRKRVLENPPQQKLQLGARFINPKTQYVYELRDTYRGNKEPGKVILVRITEPNFAWNGWFVLEEWNEPGLTPI